jgi:hypothetical protein
VIVSPGASPAWWISMSIWVCWKLDNERGSLRALVESNNTSVPLYCPIGAEVRIEAAWLHHPTITHRQADTDGP